MKIRNLALSMLDEYERGGKYINLSLLSHGADCLSQRERASLAALLYTVVEHKITYDYYISAVSKRQTADIDPHTLNILRIGVCQIVDMHSIPDFAATNETVKLARGGGERSFVNAVLRKIASLSRDGELPMPDGGKPTARYISVRYSFPLWLTRHFISLFGKDGCIAAFSHFNEASYTDLTVNLRKTTPERLAERLCGAGYPAKPSELSPITVRVSQSVDPRELPGFSEGEFFVQDTASAIAALALGVREGDRVLDLCAAPGGKSFACAMLLGTRGSVLSLDLHESKLSLIEGGRDRLGLDCISVGAADATELVPEYIGKFDRVVCDVPCSGLGVLGKKPDLRYKDAASLAELPALGARILENAAKYVKPGGALVYSTCTLNPAENEDVVSRFVGGQDELSLVDFTVGGLSSKGGMLTLLPQLLGTDGFFIAKLCRKEVEND